MDDILKLKELIDVDTFAPVAKQLQQKVGAAGGCRCAAACMGVQPPDGVWAVSAHAGGSRLSACAWVRLRWRHARRSANLPTCSTSTG